MAKKRKRKAKMSLAATGDVVFAGHSILIRLDAAAQRQAARCLAKNGKITFSMKEHTVTKLPQILDNGKQID